MTQFKAFKSDLWYGATGTFKTSNIGWLAKRFMDKFGLRTRLISSDPGGWGPIQSLVDNGTIEAWPIRIWPAATMNETLILAARGYWPRDPLDPTKGYLEPIAALKDSKIGLVAHDSLTSECELMISALKQPGKQIMEPSYRVTEGSQSFVGNSLAGFGFAQDRAYDVIMASHMMPYVQKVIWTAGEAKGEDSVTKAPVYGPELIGKKATSKVGHWVGNLLHFEQAVSKAEVDDKTQQISVTTDGYIYLRPHADVNSKIVFPAKVRAPFEFADYPEKIGPLRTKYAESVCRIYDLLDELKAKADREVVTQGPTAVAK